MEAGLWIYDDQGRERFSSQSSNITVIGSVITGKTNGSAYNSMFSKGRPVIVCLIPVEGTSWNVPDVQIVGDSIQWWFEVNNANTNQPVKIIYGVRG